MATTSGRIVGSKSVRVVFAKSSPRRRPCQGLDTRPEVVHHLRADLAWTARFNLQMMGACASASSEHSPDRNDALPFRVGSSLRECGQ